MRTPRTLPRILQPVQVDALLGALRTHRDRAMAEAMVLGGLRRCEVLGLQLEDLQVATRRVFIAEGKGGHQRQIPVSGRFFASMAAYLDAERPPGVDTDRLFVVLKGPGRGRPLSPAGLDQILDSARQRAGLGKVTCHQLRHTCLTRLRGAGMALEAVQAQAGHASIESTRIYLHLADDWLAPQYRRAAEAIDAQLLSGNRCLTTASARLKVDGDRLLLLPDQHRIPAHAASPTRPRRRTRSTPPRGPVHPPAGRPGPTSTMIKLTRITCIMPMSGCLCLRALRRFDALLCWMATLAVG